MNTFFQILVSSLETGSVYALAALGIIIVYRTSRTTNFALGTMSMFNAFVATLSVIKLGMPAWLGAIIGMITAFICGVVVDLVIMRRCKNMTTVGKQIITLGIIMLFLGVAPMVFGSVPLNFPMFIATGGVAVSGVTISYNVILNIVVGLVLMMILFGALQKSKWGLAVRVTASNEQTAKLMGVPTAMVTMGAWAVAATLGTLSALMLAPSITVNVSMMDNVQTNALIACVLGGFQTFYGPVLGAYIIGITRNILMFYVSSTWGDPILYTLILVFIIVRPNGLIGKKHIKKV